MEENEDLLIRIEEKIRMLGDRLVAKSAEVVALHGEIKNLKDKIAAQASGAANDGARPVDDDQIKAIKSELDGYVEEVQACITLVKNL